MQTEYAEMPPLLLTQDYRYGEGCRLVLSPDHDAGKPVNLIRLDTWNSLPVSLAVLFDSGLPVKVSDKALLIFSFYYNKAILMATAILTFREYHVMPALTGRMPSSHHSANGAKLVLCSAFTLPTAQVSPTRRSNWPLRLSLALHRLTFLIASSLKIALWLPLLKLPKTFRKWW